MGSKPFVLFVSGWERPERTYALELSLAGCLNLVLYDRNREVT